MKKYGILLIGCGYIGEQHIQDIYYRDNIKIVAVVDKIIEKAEKFSKKYSSSEKVLYGTNYKEFLNHKEIDIVIIATNTKYHLEILKDCLKANKNVLCEKPIGTNIDEINEFYNTVKKSNNKVLVSHILRHNKTYRKAAELIKNGEIGDVRVIRMVQNKHIKNKKRFYDLLSDCSPVVDCGVHYIDIIRWFTGLEITEISGISTKINNDLPGAQYDYGLLTMQLSNGGVAYYESSWSDTTSNKNIKEFIGTKGRINIVLRDYRIENKEEGDLIEIYKNTDNSYTQINVEAKYKDMYNQLSELIEMIETGKEGFPSIEDVFKATEIVIKYDNIMKTRNKNN